MGMLIYPIQGHWIWGGGWLSQIGFRISQVRRWSTASEGGLLWSAQPCWAPAGQVRNRRTNDPIPGHNMSTATIGVFILWIGWFGFNGGSTMRPIRVLSPPSSTTPIWPGPWGYRRNTCLLCGDEKTRPQHASQRHPGRACGNHRRSRRRNSPGSIVIGFISGILVVCSVIFFDRVKIDDPVGALSVHLVNGIWGTLAVGLFNREAAFSTAAG